MKDEKNGPRQNCTIVTIHHFQKSPPLTKRPPESTKVKYQDKNNGAEETGPDKSMYNIKNTSTEFHTERNKASANSTKDKEAILKNNNNPAKDST